MRLVTRADVVEYVRARLGHPVIDLELELAERGGLGHVHLAISDSLDWFIRENQNEAEYMDYMIVPLKRGKMEYACPADVTDAIDANASFGEFTPWAGMGVEAGQSLISTTGWAQFDMVTFVAAQRYLSDVKKLVGQQYNIHLQPDQHLLRVYPTPKENRIMVVEVYRKSKLSEIFQNILFKDLVIARVGVIWGGILSKDVTQFPGGGSVDGNKILDRAMQQLKDAEDRILGESPRPFIGVY